MSFVLSMLLEVNIVLDLENTFSHCLLIEFNFNSFIYYYDYYYVRISVIIFLMNFDTFFSFLPSHQKANSLTYCQRYIFCFCV